MLVLVAMHNLYGFPAKNVQSNTLGGLVQMSLFNCIYGVFK